MFFNTCIIAFAIIMTLLLFNALGRISSYKQLLDIMYNDIDEYKIQIMNLEQIIHEDQHNEEKIIKYSKDLLDYTTEIINQESVRQFNQFMEGIDIKKLTESQVKKLIGEISNAVHDGFRLEVINFEKLIYSKEYYESFIIAHSMYIVNQLLKDANI